MPDTKDMEQFTASFFSFLAVLYYYKILIIKIIRAARKTKEPISQNTFEKSFKKSLINSFFILH